MSAEVKYEEQKEVNAKSQLLLLVGRVTRQIESLTNNERQFVLNTVRDLYTVLEPMQPMNWDRGGMAGQPVLTDLNEL